MDSNGSTGRSSSRRTMSSRQTSQDNLSGSTQTPAKAAIGKAKSSLNVPTVSGKVSASSRSATVKAGEIEVPKHKIQRKERLQAVRCELKAIVRKVLEKCQVSSETDPKIAKKNGLMFKCKAPRPWLAMNGTAYDTDDEDDKSDNADDTKQQQPPVWLFVEASVLLAAHSAETSDSTPSDSRMETAVSDFIDKLAAYSNCMAKADNNADINGHVQEQKLLRLTCELEDYSFEAVAYLVNDYLRCSDAGFQLAHDRSGKLQKSRSTAGTSGDSSKHYIKPDDADRNKRNGAMQSKRSPKKRLRTDGGNDSDGSSSDEGEQQYKVTSFIDSFDLGQDWWEPPNQRAYERRLREMRVYPRTAEPVYELARSFGRQILESEAEGQMLWQWGVEVRRMAWSIPCFIWLSSKLTTAGTFGNAALQNYLLILLEKKYLALNEALALYQRVVKHAPIVAMYVEREITDWHTQDSRGLEWILSELDVCEASKDNPLYTVTLANEIVLRAACTDHGAQMLITNLRDAGKPKQSSNQRRLETYSHRFGRMLLIAGLRAQFTLTLSNAGVPNATLLEQINVSLAKRLVSNDAGDEDAANFVAGSSNEKSVTFSFDLKQSSTAFAEELARALNLISVDGPAALIAGKKVAKMEDEEDDTESDDEDDSQNDDDSFSRRNSSASRKTTNRKRRTAGSRRAATQQQKNSHAFPKFECQYINWQYVEVKQIERNGEEDTAALYDGASEFRALPFCYMPSEALLNTRTVRRVMPLNHPMLCMLLHALYDNEDANLLSADEEAELTLQQMQAVNGGAGRSANRRGASNQSSKPALRYHLRLTAASVKQLFSRDWIWQGSERDHKK